MTLSSTIREAQEQEQALSASLDAAREQLRAQSDAFLERSKVRSRLGNHAGALEDAQSALTLSPGSAEVSKLIAPTALSFIGISPLKRRSFRSASSASRRRSSVAAAPAKPTTHTSRQTPSPALTKGSIRQIWLPCVVKCYRSTSYQTRSSVSSSPSSMPTGRACLHPSKSRTSASAGG